MKNYNEIHLSDLASSLQNTHVKLDLGFLDKLLKNASKGEDYTTNKEFTLKIGCCYNENEKRCTTFGSWFNNNSAMSFRTFLKIFRVCMKTIFGIEPRIWIQEPIFGSTNWIKGVNSLQEIPKGYVGGLFYPKICGVILTEISINKVKNSKYFRNRYKDYLLRVTPIRGQ